MAKYKSSLDMPEEMLNKNLESVAKMLMSWDKSERNKKNKKNFK